MQNKQPSPIANTSGAERPLQGGPGGQKHFQLSGGTRGAGAPRTQTPGLQECPHCHHLPQTGSSQKDGFPQEPFFPFHLFIRKRRAKSKNSHYVHYRTQSCSNKTLLPGEPLAVTRKKSPKHPVKMLKYISKKRKGTWIRRLINEDCE